MKNQSLKKKKLNQFLTLLLSSVFMLSCSENDNKNIESIDLNSGMNKRTINDLRDKINFYYGYEIDFGVEKYLSNESINTIELIKDGVVVGYLLENNNNYGIGNISISNKILYFDILKEVEFPFDLVYNDDFDTVLPSFNDDFFDYEIYSDNRCQGNLMLCATGCTLGALGIAASDGPLPFMDVVAASFYISCNAGCALSYDLCVNPPK